MKKRILICAMAALTLIASGCSKDTKEKDLKEFTHDTYGEVELGEYKGISVEKPIYTVSEEDIDSYIESLIYEYAESSIVDRAAKEGDCLTINFTISSEGEIIYDYSEEPYYIYLGDEEYGEKFDAELIGKSAGETHKFSITYEDDYADTEFAGKTIDYDVTISEVTEETYPKLTDDFITNDLGYKSHDDMIESIKKELSEENDSQSEYSVKENILQIIIDSSKFNNYSEELYASCKQSSEDSYAEYAEMFGCSTTEELYEMFGMTEEDIEAEIMNQVYRIIVVDAIGEKEELALTNTEYKEGTVKFAEEMGYETANDLVKDYGEESIYNWLLEEKVLDFLVENAKITEVEHTEEDFEEE